MVGLAGIDFTIAGANVRAHSVLRVLAGSAGLALLRYRLGITAAWPWLARLVLLTAICGSVLTWLRFLLGTIGGADSYGYVSASQILAHGRLIDTSPIADWLAAPNRMTLASPLGWTPSPDGAGIAPTFPIGVSVVMALVSIAAGPSAVFFVAPIMGVVTLLVVYGLAREWFDDATALLATALVAWNPLVIAYAKQPMSDIPATMWVVLALWLAIRSSDRTAWVSGLAAGAAMITRPALLVAAAVIPLTAHRGESPKRRVVMSGAGLAIGVVIQMLIQYRLFGSPFSTGYGAAGNLFSLSHVDDNLRIFGGHLWTIAGPLWIAGVIAGVATTRVVPLWKPAAVLGAVTLPYLLYLPFDHWETLRFLLPGLVPLTIVAAAGLMHLARLSNATGTAAAIMVAIMAIVVGRSEYLLRTSSVWDVASLEARYPLAGDWINVNTPPESVVLANQHSGSLRWYGKRQTIRWDFLDPAQLVPTVQALQAHGATAYVALEGDEVEMFDRRFAGVIDQLQIDHVGRVRNVSFRRLVYLPPNR